MPVNSPARVLLDGRGDDHLGVPEHPVAQLVPARDLFDDGPGRHVVALDLEEGVVIVDVEGLAGGIKGCKPLRFEGLHQLLVNEFNAAGKRLAVGLAAPALSERVRSSMMGRSAMINPSFAFLTVLR